MWNLIQSDEQIMIAESARDYLSSELPIERLRPKEKRVSPAETIAGLAQLGWLGVGIAEAAGGAGLGLIEEMLVHRACGRFLASPSVLATTLAAHAAVAAGDDALASALVSGARTAALAIPTAGDAVQVFDWTEADMLLLWNDAGMGLFDPARFTGQQAALCLDDSVTLHDGVLDRGDPLLWVAPDRAPLALRAQVLLAASLTGLADHACDLAVAYAKVREQYGKPIGAFQAVKHRCADMGVRSRLAWYQTNLAALKVQAGADDAALHCASAKLLAADAAHENGRAGIQIHGGIGFQAECDAHWFVKRAHLYDQAGDAMATLARRIALLPTPQ